MVEKIGGGKSVTYGMPTKTPNTPNKTPNMQSQSKEYAKKKYAKNWYNLQYVNYYSKILIYTLKGEAIFVANLRTFLAYLLQA